MAYLYWARAVAMPGTGLYLTIWLNVGGYDSLGNPRKHESLYHVQGEPSR